MDNWNSGNQNESEHGIVTMYLPLLAFVTVSILLLFVVVKYYALGKFAGCLFIFGVLALTNLWCTVSGQRRMLTGINIATMGVIPMLCILLGLFRWPALLPFGPMIGFPAMLAWVPTLLVMEVAGERLRRLHGDARNDAPIIRQSSRFITVLLFIVGTLIFIAGAASGNGRLTERFFVAFFAIPFYFGVFALISLQQLFRSTAELPSSPIRVSGDFARKWMLAALVLLLGAVGVALISPKAPWTQLAKYTNGGTQRSPVAAIHPAQPDGNLFASDEGNAPRRGLGVRDDTSTVSGRTTLGKMTASGKHPAPPHRRTSPAARTASSGATVKSVAGQQRGRQGSVITGHPSQPDTNLSAVNQHNSPQSDWDNSGWPSSSSSKGNAGNRSTSGTQPAPTSVAKSSAKRTTSQSGTWEQDRNGGMPGNQGMTQPRSSKEQPSQAGPSPGTTLKSAAPSGDNPTSLTGAEKSIVGSRIWNMMNQVIDTLRWVSQVGEPSKKIPVRQELRPIATKATVRKNAQQLKRELRQHPWRLVKLILFTLMVPAVLIGGGVGFRRYCQRRPKVSQSTACPRRRDPFADPFTTMSGATTEELVSAAYETFLAYLWVSGHPRQAGQTEFELATWLENNSNLNVMAVWTITKFSTSSYYAQENQVPTDLRDLQAALATIIKQATRKFSQEELAKKQQQYREVYATG